MNPINWLRNIRILLKILLKSRKSLNVWIWTWMLNLFCLTNLWMILNVKMNLLRCMPSVWLLNLFLKRMKIFVAIMLWYLILCLLCVLPQRTNRCTFLHIKEIKRWRERLLSQNLHLGLNLRLWMDLSLFNLPPLWCDWSYKTSMS